MCYFSTIVQIEDLAVLVPGAGGKLAARSSAKGHSMEDGAMEFRTAQKVHKRTKQLIGKPLAAGMQVKMVTCS